MNRIVQAPPQVGELPRGGVDVDALVRGGHAPQASTSGPHYPGSGVFEPAGGSVGGGPLHCTLPDGLAGGRPASTCPNRCEPTFASSVMPWARSCGSTGAQPLLADVERLRELAIAAHDEDETVADEAGGQIERLVASWPIERAEEVARAFTVYFHLVNGAEERHRARALRAADQSDRPLSGTVGAAVDEVARLHGPEQAQALLTGSGVPPRPDRAPDRGAPPRGRHRDPRGSADLLDRLQRRPPRRLRARRDARRLLEEIDLLWRTAAAARRPPGPAGRGPHRHGGLRRDALPRGAAGLPLARHGADRRRRRGTRPPRCPPSSGSAAGSAATATATRTSPRDVTREAMPIQSEHVLRALERAAARIGRTLTVDSATTPASLAVRAVI